MFRWTGVLDRAAFAWRAAFVSAFLIGTILLFPFLLQAVVSASHCAMDTCGALGLVISAFLRPIFFVAAVAMVLSICIRRARDAGLPAWLGAFPPLMLVADQGFLQYAGAGWAYSFSAGILFASMPVYALFAIALMVLLGLPARGAFYGWERSSIDKAMLVLAGWLSISAAERAGGVLLLVFMELPREVAFILFRLFAYAPYAMPIFLALAAYRLWQSHRLAPLTPLPPAIAAAEGPSLWQLRRAAVIGAVISLGIILWSQLTNIQMTGPWALITVVVMLIPAFLPNFVIYAALAASILRLMVKRDAIAAAALCVALIPFGFWAASLSSVLRAKAQERAAIAALSKVALPAKAGGIVIEGDDWSLINCARIRVLSDGHGIDEVLTHGQSKSPYLRYTRATANAPVDKGVATDTAPSDYVLVRFPRQPPFLRETRLPPDIVTPPVEIYAVDPSGRHLVAATYTALNPVPSFPPMLTAYGWWRGDNSSTPEKSCRSVDNFLHRELLDKL
jgi:uncharacterized membrane protein YhaH (DUF805 family)